MKPDVSQEEVKLTRRQELFCSYYVSKEFFGNGVQTYIEVYEPDQTKPNWYKTACVNASEILSNPKVYNRINDLLDEAGLNDQFVDKQLLFLIQQHDDKAAKLNALKEYNKLKARIVDRTESTVTADVTSNGETIGDPTLAAGFASYLKDQTTK